MTTYPFSTPPQRKKKFIRILISGLVVLLFPLIAVLLLMLQQHQVILSVEKVQVPMSWYQPNKPQAQTSCAFTWGDICTATARTTYVSNAILTQKEFKQIVQDNTELQFNNTKVCIPPMNPEVPSSYKAKAVDGAHTVIITYYPNKNGEFFITASKTGNKELLTQTWRCLS
jgi:hypothetical protein